MTGAGKALIVTANWAAAAEQPVAAIDSVTSTVPEAPVPHVTVMDAVPAPADMVPPETVHA